MISQQLQRISFKHIAAPLHSVSITRDESLRSQLESAAFESIPMFCQPCNGPPNFFTLPFDSQEHPIQTIVSAILFLIPPNTPVTETTEKKIIRLTQKMTIICHTQHIQDPPIYVSHDFRHSLRVHRHMIGLFKKLPHLYEIAKQNHQLPHHLVDACVRLIPLLHDIGYPNQMIHQLQKSNHTIEGARLFKNQMEPLMESIISDYYEPHIAVRCNAIIRKYILYHGSDKKEDTFEIKLDTAIGVLYTNTPHLKNVLECFPTQGITIHSYEVLDRKEPGRYADLAKKNDNKLGIPFLPTDFKDDPLLCSTRIADNVDSQQNRLTSVQKKDAHYRLTQSPIISNLQDRYSLGLMPIETITVESNPNTRSLLVNVKMNELYNQMNTIQTVFNNMPIAVTHFFIERIKEALNSITYFDKPIAVSVSQIRPIPSTLISKVKKN